MKITAQDLYKLGVVDSIIPEFGGAEPANLEKIADHLREKIYYFLSTASRKTGETLAQERYNRFRAF